MLRAWEDGLRPTAVLAMCDVMAIGAMRALRELRLDVPGDVSVVGFDDIDLAPHVDPPLTTVHQPIRRKGEEAVRRSCSGSWSDATASPSTVGWRPASSCAARPAGRGPECVGLHTADRGRPYTPRPVADLPIDLAAGLAESLARALDVEAKIPRALEALGPVADRDVLVLRWRRRHHRARQLAGLGGPVTSIPADRLEARTPFGVADASADVLVACWSAFRGAHGRRTRPAEPAAAAGWTIARRPRLRSRRRLPPAPIRSRSTATWSRRDGPFLANGFKVRVVHCFWTFDSIEDERTFLGEAFGEVGRTSAREHEPAAADLQRGRLPPHVRGIG